MGMEKIAVIKLVEEKINPESLDSNIVLNGIDMNYREFLEKYATGFIKDTTNPDIEAIATYFNDNFGKYLVSKTKEIEAEQRKINYVRDYCMNITTKSPIFIGDSVMTIEQYLIKLVHEERMNDDFTITWGPFNKDINQVVNALLRNNRDKLDLKDEKYIIYEKKELIDECINKLKENGYGDVLSSHLDEDEETFEEALKEDLLSKLDNDMTIKVNGSAISLGDYAIKQSDYARKQIQEMVNKYNKVNDKPVMVGEINLTPSRNGLEITGEIPVILNDADKESIINQVNNDDLTISNQIASSIKAIKETKSKGMLDLIGAHLEEISRETLNEHETSLLDYAKKALDQQEKYIIKSSNNDDDFKVVLSKRLQEIDGDINNLIKEATIQSTDIRPNLSKYEGEIANLSSKSVEFNLDNSPEFKVVNETLKKAYIVANSITKFNRESFKSSQEINDLITRLNQTLNKNSSRSVQEVIVDGIIEKLESIINQGNINDYEKKEFLNTINNKLKENGYEPIREGIYKE